MNNDIGRQNSDGTSNNNNCMEWCNNNASCGGFAAKRNICYFKNNACDDNLQDGDRTVLFLKQGS